MPKCDNLKESALREAAKIANIAWNAKRRVHPSDWGEYRERDRSSHGITVLPVIEPELTVNERFKPENSPPAAYLELRGQSWCEDGLSKIMLGIY
jgi:hypothetical protein